MNVKLFIVDDHYMVIEGIRSLLEQSNEIEWMGHATTADSCLAFLQHNQPDVVLMDINLPDLSGIDLCREVKTRYPAIFVLGLSTFNQQSFIQRMINNGASGYVLKNATQSELLEAIQSVAKGDTYLSDAAAAALVQPSSSGPVLTRREKEVLGWIADGLTNHEIAQRIFVSASTVDTHRKNLLAKLEAKNTAELIRLAIRYHLLSAD